MEYTKSEIWELSSLIDDDLVILEHYTKLYIPDPITGLAELCSAEFAVMRLDAHLKCIKKYCIDTDDYNLADEIVGKVTPVWEKYILKVTNQEELDRLRTKPGESHFISIQETMLNWLDWFDKYKATHPKQDTTTSTKSGEERGSIQGEKDQPKMKYESSVSESSARDIFGLLYQQNYISQDTDTKDWLFVCCGIGEVPKKPIDWRKGQNELVYFVDGMFGDENENDIWAITSRVFTIKGKAQSINGLRVANSKVSIKKEKKMKLDKILRHK